MSRIKINISLFKFKDIVFYFILILTVLYYSYIIFISENTFDYGDGIQHYLIAKYSWKHPELFLDLWGKPIFTLLSSPFAQFGLKGIAFFQLLCALLSTIIAYKILSLFQVKIKFLVPLFIFFSPIYFAVLNSGLTEILFSLTLLTVIYLFIKHKFILASILFSFAFFVRPEAYFILPLIILYLIIKKQWISIPLLSTGFIMFSIIGAFYYKDILWVIHNNYQVSQNYPQKGELWHYLNKYSHIWGSVHFFLLIFSIALIIIQTGLNIFKKEKLSLFIEEKFLLIMGSVVVVFVLHTLMNWLPGIHSNLGMQRFFAGIIPLSAILSINGLELFILQLRNFIHNDKIFQMLKILIVLLLSYQMIQAPYLSEHYPFKLSHEQIVVNYAAEYLKNTMPIKNKKICYLHPQFAVALNIDPFDNNTTQLLWSFDKNNIHHYSDSTVILWDAHFSPLEGNLPLHTLLNNKDILHLKTLKYIDTSNPFEVYMFLKISHANTFYKNQSSIDCIGKYGPIDVMKKDSLYNNFDTSVILQKTISSNIYSSAPYSLYFDGNEWGVMFSKSYTPDKKVYAVSVQFSYYPKEELKDVLLIIHVTDKENKDIYWWGEKIKPTDIAHWNTFKLSKTIDLTGITQNYHINVYFWNKSKSNFYVDDMKIYYHIH